MGAEVADGALLGVGRRAAGGHTLGDEMKLVIRKKYTLICADPPWPYASQIMASKKKYTKITDQYPVLSVKDICNFDVAAISMPNSILALWTTDAFLEYALLVMRSWGFTYKTVCFWWHKLTKSGKTRTNMGVYTLKCGELCLLGTRGKTKHLIKDRSVRQLIEAVNLGHSQKPDEAYKRLRYFVPEGNALEMFARKKRIGWDVFGNEVENSIHIQSRERDKLNFSGMNLCGTENSLPKHLRSKT
jgi:site-specific DNA-methyltransferase (adenine-specific)